MVSLSEGSYSIICQYTSIFEKDITNQTLLPVKLKKASKVSEVYVIPSKLELKTNIHMINENELLTGTIDS